MRFLRNFLGKVFVGCVNCFNDVLSFYSSYDEVVTLNIIRRVGLLEKISRVKVLNSVFKFLTILNYT